jgi:peroxiredoxin
MSSAQRDRDLQRSLFGFALSGADFPLRRKGTNGAGGRAWAAAALLLACLFAVPACDYASGPRPSGTPQEAVEGTTTGTGERAPDFVLKDLKGQAFRLSDYRGKKPVLIIFSTTWCPSCREEIPHFKKIHETYSGPGLEVVNVDIQESRAKVSSFADKYSLPYRVLLDEDGTVSDVYDIRGVPSLVLIGKDGMIVCRQCRGVETILDTLMKK